MVQPQYLYRYTDADSLEYMLLGERTIRFNPLTYMDDAQEKKSKYENRTGVHRTDQLGMFFFINSWTDNEEEDRRMYEHYGNSNHRGIRIKLPVNPFSKQRNRLTMDINGAAGTAIALQADYLETRYGCKIGFENHSNYLRRLEQEDPVEYRRLAELSNWLMRSSVSCITKDVDKLLVKVEYTEDQEKVIPTIQHVFGTQGWSDFSAFGRYKNSEEWSYQSEWRYMLVFTMSLAGMNKGDKIEWYPLPFDHYDLKLDEGKLREMEITFSPYISEEGKAKVRDIVRRSGMDIPLRESSLRVARDGSV